MEGAAWAVEIRDRPVVDARARIVALGAAVMSLLQSDLAAALELSAVAEELAASTGAAPPLMAVAGAGIVALMHGDSDTALAAHRRVVEMGPDEPDPAIRAHAYFSAIAGLGLCGDFETLAVAHREVETLANQLDNRLLDASVAGALAPIIHLIDPDGAEAVLTTAYELNDELGNFQANVSMAMFLALYYLRGGDLAARGALGTPVPPDQHRPRAHVHRAGSLHRDRSHQTPRAGRGHGASQRPARPAHPQRPSGNAGRSRDRGPLRVVAPPRTRRRLRGALHGARRSTSTRWPCSLSNNSKKSWPTSTPRPNPGVNSDGIARQQHPR